MSEILKSKINMALSIQVVIERDQSLPDEEGYVVYRQTLDQQHWEKHDWHKFDMDTNSKYFCDSWQEAELAFNCLLAGMDRDILDSYVLYAETHCSSENIQKLDAAIKDIANLQFGSFKTSKKRYGKEVPSLKQFREERKAEAKCNIGFGSWG